MMSVVTHLVLSIPIMTRLSNNNSLAGSLAKYSGFVLAAQEFAVLLLLRYAQRWYITRRLPVALSSRLFRLAMHLTVWLQYPPGALVLKHEGEDSSSIDLDAGSHAAYQSLLIIPVQSFMHITSLGLPFTWQLAVALGKAVVDLCLALPRMSVSVSLHAYIRNQLLEICEATDAVLQIITASPGAEQHYVTCRYAPLHLHTCESIADVVH